MAKVKLNLGSTKDALSEGIDNLRASLREHPSLPLKLRLQYKKALFDMSFAHALLRKIKCVQPEMSFEIPPPPPPFARRAKGRKRRKK
jgi:hypothetical protein